MFLLTPRISREIISIQIIGRVYNNYVLLLFQCMKGQKEEDVLSQVYAACEKTGTIIEAVFVTNAELRLARLISCLSAMDKVYETTDHKHFVLLRY